MRKIVLAVSALALTAPAFTAPAMAHRTGYSHSHRADYQRDHRDYRRDHRDYRVCKKRSGTTGLIVGGAGGALVGREIDKHGDRATGTILGAAVGALLGRHVERNVMSKKCR